MTYVIAEPDIDIADRGCVDKCPVAGTFERNRARYIDLDESLDGEACEPVPVEGIYNEEDVPERWSIFAADNGAVFAEPLPGAVSALAFACGAVELGALSVGAERVAASYPFRDA